MKLIRNKEIRRLIFLHVSLTLFLAALSAFTRIPAPLIVMLGGVLYALLHFGYTRRRYHDIEALSNVLNRILHGHEQLLINENQEGELSILQSEIQKMTLRLKESADALQADKLHLVDAIAEALGVAAAV